MNINEKQWKKHERNHENTIEKPLKIIESHWKRGSKGGAKAPRRTSRSRSPVRRRPATRCGARWGSRSSSTWSPRAVGSPKMCDLRGFLVDFKWFWDDFWIFLVIFADFPKFFVVFRCFSSFLLMIFVAFASLSGVWPCFWKGLSV